MKVAESLPYVRKYFSNCNWEASDFCWKKAFISAVFSNVAYCHIPNFELENSTHVNLIPSYEYKNSIEYFKKYKTKVDIKRLLGVAEIDSVSFIVERLFAIALVIRIDNVVFVSLKGTELSSGYDWRINSNIWKTSPDDSSIKFHRGFFGEVLSFKEEVENRIIEEFGANINVYVTGHSLGGAMAAILYGLWSSDQKHFGRAFQNYRVQQDPHIVSAYTYGMPRYGNSEAVSFYPNPYHVLNSKDLVPNLPSKIFGYEDCHNEYPLDESLVLKAEYQGDFSRLKVLGSIITARKFEHHYMELYVERVLYEVKKEETSS